MSFRYRPHWRAREWAPCPLPILSRGERAGRRFIEFFTANIRNRNTRLAYARAVKQFFDWSEERGLGLDDIEPIVGATYVEQLGLRLGTGDFSEPSGSKLDA
jgi:hypothetical protein